MSVNQLLFWERHRPKTLEEIVLPERIKKHFTDGIKRNYIFHGQYGTGKTSLARILIGSYTKDKAFIEINSSLYTSIDLLREEVDKFCKMVPMFESDDPIKYVFLDEFERASKQFQDAFKAFIETYSNVRFILVTNHYNKIEDGLKSRFTSLNFNTQSPEEEKVMKIGIFKVLKDIAEKEKVEVDKKTLINIITKKFPDNRAMVEEIGLIKQLGSESEGNISIDNKTKQDLYDIIYNDVSYEKIYSFLMTSFGPEKIDELFDILGRSFIDMSISEKKNVDKLFECNNIISDYRFRLDSKTDPIVLGMTVIGKFKKLLNQ